MKIMDVFFIQRRTIIVCIVALLYAVAVGYDILHSNGWGDATKKAGTPGCICHDFQTSNLVHVWVAGPDSVAAGSTNNFMIFMTGGPAVQGGYNVACNLGELIPGDSTSDYAPNIAGELTHSTPKEFLNDTVSWLFKYKAPSTTGTDTIYSVANSVNGNNNPDFDDIWNFGENFPVKIYPASDVAETGIPFTYKLEQNYPNPFNPTTMISYQLERESFVEITLFNIEGRIVSILEKGRKDAGLHSVPVNGSDLVSGVYFYRIQTKDFSDTKKMLLLK